MVPSFQPDLFDPRLPRRPVVALALGAGILLAATALVAAWSPCFGVSALMVTVPVLASWTILVVDGRRQRWLYGTALQPHLPAIDGEWTRHRHLLDVARARRAGDARIFELTDRLAQHYAAARIHLLDLQNGLVKHDALGLGPPRERLAAGIADAEASLAKASEAIRWLHAAVLLGEAGVDPADRAIADAMAQAGSLLEVESGQKPPSIQPIRSSPASGTASAQRARAGASTWSASAPSSV
jgi:hypothetical protein